MNIEKLDFSAPASEENKNLTPEEMGELFNSSSEDGYDDFNALLRKMTKQNPEAEIHIVADWVDEYTPRAAKGFLDRYGSKCKKMTFAVRCTREQYDKDVNAFASGLEWIEVNG